MSRTIWVGAVAYDPKVVTIWEGMRRYFHEEAQLPVEVVLFQSYEMQVAALLAAPGDPAPRIDIAGTPISPICRPILGAINRCRPIAMRDTDLGWMTKIVAASGGPVSKLSDLRNRTLALGSRDSGHAAILPVHFLEREGLVEGRDYRTLRFDSDVGKHGDTGASEVEVVRAVLDGRADAGAIGSPFWKTVRAERLVPEGALTKSGRRRPTITACSRHVRILIHRWGAVRRGSFRDELRQSEPPRRARRRGSASLGGAAPRRLRLLARGVCAPGVFKRPNSVET